MRAFCRVCMAVAILVFVIATLEMLKKQEPFYSGFYCFAWWSFILFSEAFLHVRGGRSLLFDEPLKFLVLLPLSVTTWLVFELFNFRLHNWHYLNVVSETGLRWLGYTVSFATVLPGIFTTTHLLEHLGVLKNVRNEPLKKPERLYGFFVAVGLAFLVLPLVWPRYFFPLVWGGFIFLLEPLNHAKGARSLLRDWEHGSLRTFYLLLIAGVCCGFLWELWNFWAGAKWAYTIPYVHRLQIFEMPILGFLGFPPFAVECYVMVNTYFWIGRRVKTIQDPRKKRRVVALLVLGMLCFDLLVFAGIDRFTVQSFASWFGSG